MVIPLHRKRKTPGRQWPRQGIALFLVIGILSVLSIIALYLFSFSGHQRFQSHILTSGERAYQAADFGARQGLLLLQRSADFFNSTAPETLPKYDKAPEPVRRLIRWLVNQDGTLKTSHEELELPMPLVDETLVKAHEPAMTLRVTLRLQKPTPLFESAPIPGWCEPPTDFKGRLVIDALASFKGTMRRVMATTELRLVQMTLPVTGRFVLTTHGWEGPLNTDTVSLSPEGSSQTPPGFRPDNEVAPLIVNAGPGAEPPSPTGASPHETLNRNGWILLHPPESDRPTYWTINIAPGAPKGTGEHFLLGRGGIHLRPIPSGGPGLGREVVLPSGGDTYRLWETHELYAFLSGLYPAARQAPRQFFLHGEEENGLHSSRLRLMGTDASPSPTLVFGPVYRRFLLEQGLRQKPRPGTPGEPLAAPCPFVTPGVFPTPDWTPGIDGDSVQVLQQACGNSFAGYQQVMSRVVSGPFNDGLACFYDQQASSGQTRTLQPSFHSESIAKLGRNLQYRPDTPDGLLLTGESTFFRGGQQVFQGRPELALPNLGGIVSRRSGRHFPNQTSFLQFLDEHLKAGRPVTGAYHLDGPFVWTDACNRLCIGGLLVTCTGAISIKAGIHPLPHTGCPDAINHPVTLVSLNSDISVDTHLPVHAALAAPKGCIRLTSPQGTAVRGLVAAARLEVLSTTGGGSRTLTYDPQYDWAEPLSWQQGFRLLLEDTPRVFTARLE